MIGCLRPPRPALGPAKQTASVEVFQQGCVLLAAPQPLSGFPLRRRVLGASCRGRRPNQSQAHTDQVQATEVFLHLLLRRDSAASVIKQKKQASGSELHGCLRERFNISSSTQPLSLPLMSSTRMLSGCSSTHVTIQCNVGDQIFTLFANM